MAIVIKTLKGGRQYRYEQTSQRVGGKVVTKSVYLGPVNPKRKRLTIGAALGELLKGGVQLGATAAAGKLGPAGGKAHKPSYRALDPRSVHPIPGQILQSPEEQRQRYAPVRTMDDVEFHQRKATMEMQIAEQVERDRAKAIKDMDAPVSEQPTDAHAPDATEDGASED